MAASILESVRTRLLQSKHLEITSEENIYTLTLKGDLQTDETFNKAIGDVEEIVTITHIWRNGVVFVLNPDEDTRVLRNVIKLAMVLVARQEA